MHRLCLLIAVSNVYDQLESLPVGNLCSKLLLNMPSSFRSLKFFTPGTRDVTYGDRSRLRVNQDYLVIFSRLYDRAPVRILSSNFQKEILREKEVYKIRDNDFGVQLQFEVETIDWLKTSHTESVWIDHDWESRSQESEDEDSGGCGTRCGHWAA